jgi:hypothetical protein
MLWIHVVTSEIDLIWNGFDMIFDPRNMVLDPLIIILVSAILAEIWWIIDSTGMATLICIKMICGTSSRLFNKSIVFLCVGSLELCFGKEILVQVGGEVWSDRFQKWRTSWVWYIHVRPFAQDSSSNNSNEYWNFPHLGEHSGRHKLSI